MAHQIWSDDGELSSFQQGYQKSDHSTAQQPTSTEEIWDTYFEGDSAAYQGLDEEWIQGIVSESEAFTGVHNPLDQKYYPHQQQDSLDHSANTGTSAFNSTNVQSIVGESKQNKPKRSVAPLVNSVSEGSTQ